ncbi:hypothetical protein K435DRAFT_649169, partial [Dendrothele bispora CBS 962.96]
IVTSLYSKGGGKSGAHSWVSSVDRIGAVSYISTQIYQWSGRRRFSTVHADYGAVLGRGLRRFAHIPSHSFLVLLNDSTVTLVQDGAQVSDIAWKMYQDLKDECEAIFTAVKTLSKKQKGQGGAGDEEINENFE